MNGRRKPRVERIASNPVARAIALPDFFDAARTVRIQLYMRADGEDCTELLSQLAGVIGSVCVAGQEVHGRTVWVGQLHGALRTVIDLCMNGYRWCARYTAALDRAVEICIEQIPSLPNRPLGEAFMQARALADDISAHRIKGDEVSAA